MKRTWYMEEPLVPSSGKARAPRSRDKLLVSYTIDADAAPEYTETYDIAIGGLAMFTNAPLQADLLLTIDLELRGEAVPKLCLSGSVRWSTYDPLLGKHRTGVSFTDSSAALQRELLRYIDTLQMLRELDVR
jgi:c-di-GMP-binding flagellar brake protein YcgR